MPGTRSSEVHDPHGSPALLLPHPTSPPPPTTFCKPNRPNQENRTVETNRTASASLQTGCPTCRTAAIATSMETWPSDFIRQGGLITGRNARLSPRLVRAHRKPTDGRPSPRLPARRGFSLVTPCHRPQTKKKGHPKVALSDNCLTMSYFHKLDAHYHRRYGVSLSCSGWEGVVPPRYGHQA